MAVNEPCADRGNAKDFLLDWRLAVLPLGVVVFLWFRLIDHLRIEWSVNTQYAYGWAVPLLCLYLLWRRVSQSAHGNRPMTKAESQPASFAREHSKPFLSYWVLGPCALAYAPTRLIQEANPEWRLVSWALALEVIAITLALVSLLAIQRPSSILPLRPSAFVFPLCFFLVAVPWPTLVEGPLIQGLTRANTSATVEVLGVLRVPAVQQGNAIEVGTGVVGIDEACSGIRSFQASLMIALFFGELYRLRHWGRLALCVSGFVLSLVFNVARTTLLTLIAAHQGTEAMARWHDPAGVAILLGCFLCLWLLAFGLAAKARARRESGGWRREGTRTDRGIHEIRGKESVGGGSLGSPVSSLKSRAFGRAWLWGLVFVLWIVLVEVGTESWYRLHERGLPSAVAWTVALPREKAGSRKLPLSENTRRFLRYDEAQTAAWEESAERRFQAFFFRWNPGRAAAYLAKSHTPAVCLTASGHQLLRQSEPRVFTAHGLQLPFRSYVFKEGEAPLRVYYCLWEDRSSGQSFGPATLSYRNRFAPVMAGCRNSGQRSLELAVWGVADDQEADAEFQRQLEQLIRL